MNVDNLPVLACVQAQSGRLSTLALICLGCDAYLIGSTSQDRDTGGNDAGNAYSAKKGEVSAAQMSVEEYNAKIQEFRDNETALEGEAAAAQAALAQQILQQQQQQQQQGGDTGGDGSDGSDAGNAGDAGNTPQIPTENTGGSISYSDADLKLMAAIIQAEAGGESYAGQLAV